MEQKERNVEFFISNIGGKESAEVIDLNKIFQMNFSYNFDLLKNLIEALMKNQKNFQTELKERRIKIVELENQLLDLKLASGKTEIPKSNVKLEPSSFQQIELGNESTHELSPKLLLVLKGDKNSIKEPPNDIQLEESAYNDEKINKIIVSTSYLFNLIFYLEKNKWNE